MVAELGICWSRRWETKPRPIYCEKHAAVLTPADQHPTNTWAHSASPAHRYRLGMPKRRSLSPVTAQPIQPDQPDTGSYEVIHLGGSAAVVVAMNDFLRLRALEEQACSQELEDAEDLAALRDWQARERDGRTSYHSVGEVYAQLGLGR